MGFEHRDDLSAALPTDGGTLFVLDESLGGADGVGRGVSLFVHIGTRLDDRARELADIVLPTTTFAEMDGTFVNFEGRVQRFTQAVRPPGMARPAWLTGSAALSRLGAGAAFRSAAEAFAALARDLEAFRGLSYEALGLNGAPLAGAATGAGTGS